MERTYADKPVHFFHIILGENAVQALDFQKHYRSTAGFLLDPTYEVARKYEAMGWPTYVVIGPDGTLAGRWLGLEKNRVALRKALHDALGQAKGGPPKGAFCTADTCYVPTATTPSEMQPALAADDTGRVHLVFVREKGGHGDLYHRIWDGQAWSDAQPITRVAADHYAPALCADRHGGVWLAWCSNQAASGKYDVYAARFDGQTWSPPQAVTECDDDAAHPRVAVDTAGNVWVTYYRWIPWGPRLSRDREIFARYYDGKTWSPEAQLSPTDVPKYEDHTDPAITADSQGNVWVAWSWDTHPQNDWPYAPTFGPSIFARRVRAGDEPQPLQMVGVRAPSKKAAEASPTFAFEPSIVCRENRPLVLMPAHELDPTRHFALATWRGESKGFPAPTRVATDAKLVCTPRLIEDRRGRVFATWSAVTDGVFAVRLAEMDTDGQWSPARTVWSDEGADLRFPTAAFDAGNRLHLAAIRIADGKSEVALKMLEPP